MTAGTEDVTASNAASLKVTPHAAVYSNYSVSEKHIWGSRSEVALLKQYSDSFAAADSLCITGRQCSLSRNC
jgi:hypothetical protein